MKELSILNQLRPVTVGFDSVFDNFERMFSDDFFKEPSSYPAYNIVKTKDNHYDVEVALAGFNKKDIKVSYADGQLSIESVKNDKTKERDENGNVIHQGIAKRYFNEIIIDKKMPFDNRCACHLYWIRVKNRKKI